MPKVFGWQHMVILAIFVVVLIASVVLSKIFLKTEKQQKIYIKIIAGLLLISIICARIAVAFRHGRWTSALPYTYCSMSSLVISMLVLFGKPNMKAYQCFWYMAFVGGLVTMIYPEFIGQNASIFYPATITGILHHAFAILLCVAMLQYGWFKPSLRYCYYYPMMFCSYIVMGTFMIHVCKMDNAMCITAPELSGTPLYWWFFWIVGTILIVILSVICELCRMLHNKKQTKKLTENNANI